MSTKLSDRTAAATKVEEDELVTASSNAETLVTQSAYTELIELTQRKFLRQMAIFSETATSRPFPRLFCIDLESSSSPIIDSSSVSTSNRLCLKALCESDTGWHAVERSLNYETLAQIPESHYAYLIRILNLIKHSNLDLNILKTISTTTSATNNPNINNNTNSNKLDEIINYMEEYFEEMTSTTTTNSTSTPSNVRSKQMEQHQIYSLKESYGSLKTYVMAKIMSAEQPTPTRSTTRSTNSKESPQQQATTEEKKKENNPNVIEYFNLSRCSLPSGKVVWLCNEHSNEQHVQLLTSVESYGVSQFQNDEFNSILLEELKRYSRNSS
jgi:hypothetical protein